MKHKAKIDTAPPEKRKWLDPDTYIDLNTNIKYKIDSAGQSHEVKAVKEWQTIS